jgi:hypothetical protein
MKELVDPQAQMIIVALWWEKIAENPQTNTKNKFSQNETMCKDKWNSLNSNYKKIFDFFLFKDWEPYLFLGFVVWKQRDVSLTSSILLKILWLNWSISKG